MGNKHVWLWLVAALLAACNNSTGDKDTGGLKAELDTLQEAVTDAEVSVVHQSFPQLFQYLSKQDSTFSEDSFMLSGESKVEQVPPMPVDEARLKPFQQYFIYNQDSSLALDLYSYNYIIANRGGNSTLEEAGPDSEAAVIDRKAGLRRRVFFGGPSHTLWDAKWVTAQELMLIGAETRENDRVIPTIWKVNLQDTSVQVFAYQGDVQANMAGYRREKLAQALVKKENLD
jgi:hypothetical protein